MPHPHGITPSHAPAVGAPGSPTVEDGSPLRRSIGTWGLYLFILGDVLGAGVYVLVGEVAGIAGGAVWVPLLMALLLALLTAGSYAELATKYPRAGGSSHYAQRAFGPFWAFLVGFCMLAAGIVSVGALALGFAGDYLAAFVDLPVPLTVALFLALLAALNMRGIKESMGANAVATVIEVSGLVLVLVLGLLVIGRGDADLSRLTQLGSPGHGPVSAVLAASVLAFYSYVGFETSVNVAEEARDPARSYPRALFAALLTAGIVYIGVGVAASAIVPTDQLVASSGPLLEVVRAAGGVPVVVFSLVALVAVANGALLTGIMGSRLAYGMARDGLLPSALGRVLPGRRTPWVAILATTGLSLLPVLGLLSCLLLATRVEGDTWRLGLPLLAVGAVLAALAAHRHRTATAG